MVGVSVGVLVSVDISSRVLQPVIKAAERTSAIARMLCFFRFVPPKYRISAVVCPGISILDSETLEITGNRIVIFLLNDEFTHCVLHIHHV